MHTATKKVIAGVTLLACVIVLVTTVAWRLPFVVIVKKTLLATAVFGSLSFLGGLIYEKLWLR